WRRSAWAASIARRREEESPSPPSSGVAPASPPPSPCPSPIRTKAPSSVPYLPPNFLYYALHSSPISSTYDPLVGAIAEHGKTASAVAFEEKRLRQFDLDMRYGPCLGLSRMERWDRAAAMGLNPPGDVEAILLKSSAAAADCHWEGRI
ncbi:unnamed protein product, partial [Musa acuminata subsp. burmannicoides]